MSNLRSYFKNMYYLVKILEEKKGAKAFKILGNSTYKMEDLNETKKITLYMVFVKQ